MPSRPDVLAAGFFLALSLDVCAVGLKLGLGSLRGPGSGFIPFFAGLGLGLLALGLIGQTVLGRGGCSERGAERRKWGSISLVFLCLTGYLAGLRYLGFPLSTAFFVTALSRGVAEKGWASSVALALCVTLGSYALFGLWLGAELPVGILGF